MNKWPITMLAVAALTLGASSAANSGQQSIQEFIAQQAQKSLQGAVKESSKKRSTPSIGEVHEAARKKISKKKPNNRTVNEEVRRKASSALKKSGKSSEFKK